MRGEESAFSVDTSRFAMDRILGGEILRRKAVTIYWHYPVRLERILMKDVAKEIGIYCIYRKFGRNTTLLYIGKTSFSFESRLISHEQSWLSDLRGDIFVRCGVMQSPLQYDDHLLEDIESALIYAIQPAYNEKKRNCYTYRTEYYVLLHNTGFRGALPRTIDASEQRETTEVL